MKIEHRIKFKNAKIIYVCIYKSIIIMHHYPNRHLSEDRKFTVGCWHVKYKKDDSQRF